MITIRAAHITDTPALTILMHHLGYQATENDVHDRFTHILQHPDYLTLVAVDQDGIVAGMIGLIKSYHYEHNGCYVRIAAMVVKEEFRRLGIGKQLMQEAEQWALQNNANALLLNSGKREERIAAYAFYQSLGYAIKSSGFIKWLNQ